MASWTRRLVMGVVLGSFAALLSSYDVQAADDKKVPSIETIMKKVNGKKGYTAKITEAAKGEKWDEAATAAKELKAHATALAKNDAPKGDKASWEKLAKQYGEQGTAVADAVEKKDAKALATATKAFTSGCKTCHDSFK
ncbi:hypothetical protein BH11PLA2_BH11PLA2_37650 [soil metagenome]